MASNITVDTLTVDTLTKGSTTLNTDEIVDTNSSQVCKAWVNFKGNGTVAIRDSFNVSSITDFGTGIYTIYFDVDMPNTNYSSALHAGDSGHWSMEAKPQSETMSAAAFTLKVHAVNSSGALYDTDYISYQAFSN